MRRLGTLTRIGNDRGLVTLANPEQPPAIGTVAIDETLNEIGAIVDIIGPVAEPWAVVVSDPAVELTDHLDSRLYARDEAGH